MKVDMLGRKCQKCRRGDYTVTEKENLLACKRCKHTVEMLREVDVSPTKTFAKNKTNWDLRTFTKKFSLLKPHKRDSFETGNVYYVHYPTNETLTDKWHQIAVVYCLGRYKNEHGVTFSRNINLFYLPLYNQLQILQHGHDILEKKRNVKELIYATFRLHETLQNSQYCYAIKDFVESRVNYCRMVPREEWGMIPLLKRDVFGKLSIPGLMESFEAENQKPVVIFKEKKKVAPVKEKEFSEEIDNEGDIDYDVAFDYESPWRGVEYIDNKL